ncbi:MAG: TrbG/VirB9 family P-type conjugative transfer protein [Novosphingobium sp.]|jgi:type IV secretion system protein VirB9|nr:TrbG/VirB9 family P-type conjugative transfer protein [Novosphingobium sp.]
MKSSILLPLGLACLSSLAMAKDPRLAARTYNPDEVVRIDGQLGVQASITFAEDERIENVAVGDAASWQITPNKRANLLFVKPLAGKARTNMTVITDRRTYFFDLVAGNSPKPLYVIRFTYPDEPKPAPQQAAAPALNEAEAQLAEGEKPIDPALLNFQWARRGDARIQPVQLYDDGQSTYLTWSRDVPLPAILIRDETGAEGPVNYAVRGDTIVIEGVPSPIFLRAGRNSAQLEYRGAPRTAAASNSVPAVPTLAAATKEP